MVLWSWPRSSRVVQYAFFYFAPRRHAHHTRIYILFIIQPQGYASTAVVRVHLHERTYCGILLSWYCNARVLLFLNFDEHICWVTVGLFIEMMQHVVLLPSTQRDRICDSHYYGDGDRDCIRD